MRELEIKFADKVENNPNKQEAHKTKYYYKESFVGFEDSVIFCITSVPYQIIVRISLVLVIVSWTVISGIINRIMVSIFTSISNLIVVCI